MAGEPIECSWWEIARQEDQYIYREIATGRESHSRDLPVGALFCARRRNPEPNAYPPIGPDGYSIVCVLPDRHFWYIDARASNCGLPDDRQHRCWVRHGSIGERITVDKNGLTCPAGAGSIQTASWHGFLRDGRLVLA